MELNSFANASEAENFSEDFLNELKKYPFGTISKSTMDCFIFHLLNKYNLIPGTTNRQKAENLCITETVLKNYALKSNMNYTPKSIENSMKKLTESLSSGNSAKNSTPLTFDGEYIMLVIEDPVIRADLISCLKNKGIFSDTSFNKEVIKIKTSAFVCFFVESVEQEEEKKKVLELLKTDDLIKEKSETLQIQYWGTKEFFEGAIKVVKNTFKEGRVNCVIELFSFVLKVAAKKCSTKLSG